MSLSKEKKRELFNKAYDIAKAYAGGSLNTNLSPAFVLNETYETIKKIFEDIEQEK